MLWGVSGATTTDLWVYDAVTEKLFDSLTGIANTFSGTTGCGGVWFGAVNTVSVTSATGWRVDRVGISDQGAIGRYAPNHGMGVPAGV